MPARPEHRGWAAIVAAQALLLTAIGVALGIGVMVWMLIVPSSWPLREWVAVLSAAVTALAIGWYHSYLRWRRLREELAEQIAQTHRSEERFRDLTELSSDWYWEQDADFRSVLISGGAFEKVGLQRGLYLGKRRWETSSFGLSEAEWEAHRQSVFAHQPFSDLVYQRPAANGELRWVSISGRPIFSAGGEFLGYRGTGKDITDRKNADLRSRVELEVPRILNETDDVGEAVERLIATFAMTLGWDCGARWVADGGFPAIVESWPRNCSRERLAGALALVEDVLLAGDAGWQRPDASVGGGVNFACPIRAAASTVGVLVFSSFAGAICRHEDPALAVLGQSIGSQLGQFLQRKATEANLVHAAMHDWLTGLANRHLFRVRLEHALQRAKREAMPLAVLFLDLDGFKDVNDRHGHEMGDLLLRDVAKRLLGCLRESDTIARFGGDEFMILIERLIEPGEVAGITDKLITNIAEPYLLPRGRCEITVSIGVALYPEHGTDFGELVKAADAAMYRAKDLGKNGYQLAARGGGR